MNGVRLLWGMRFLQTNQCSLLFSTPFLSRSSQIDCFVIGCSNMTGVSHSRDSQMVLYCMFPAEKKLILLDMCMWDGLGCCTVVPFYPAILLCSCFPSPRHLCFPPIFPVCFHVSILFTGFIILHMHKKKYLITCPVYLIDFIGSLPLCNELQTGLQL